MKSKVERIVADLGLVTGADVEPIVENGLVRLALLIKSDLEKTAQTTIEDTLQSSYFNSHTSL